MIVYHGGIDIIEKQNMDTRLAMDIYYRSLLCKQVHNGENGIQYLDYKYLVEDLLEMYL